MVVIHTSPSPTPMICAVWAPLLTSPRCCKKAPLGKPVVPEVYWIITASLGLTAGKAIEVSSPAATKASHCAKRITSRSSGQRARICSIVAHIGLPRNSSTTTTPAQRDCLRMYSTSAARRPGLTVTSTSPAMAAPNSIITHSGRFCAHTATRSPGLKRVVSARAVRWHCVCSSA